MNIFIFNETASDVHAYLWDKLVQTALSRAGKESTGHFFIIWVTWLLGCLSFSKSKLCMNNLGENTRIALLKRWDTHIVFSVFPERSPGSHWDSSFLGGSINRFALSDRRFRDQQCSSRLPEWNIHSTRKLRLVRFWYFHVHSGSWWYFIYAACPRAHTLWTLLIRSDSEEIWKPHNKLLFFLYERVLSL